MAAVTYHVVVRFDRNGDGEIVAGEALEMPNIEAARRRATFPAKSGAGAVAFTRVGDPASGEFWPAAIIAQIGDVDLDALTA